MPLRAKIENKEIISTFLTKNEWLDIKNRVKSEKMDVIICQTSKKGYLRTSKKGIQHFVHKKGEKPENWKPESAEHLAIKNEILLGCKNANWSAKPEFAENDWEADVLTYKKSKRIAFEVQLSYQTLDKTIERQEKFIKDKVRGCWFFKKIPKGFYTFEANYKIPFFNLNLDSKEQTFVQFYENKIPLKIFISNLLSGMIKYNDKMTFKKKQKVKMNIYEYKCFGCGTIQNHYFIDGKLKSKCNHNLPLDENFNSNSKFKFHPAIINKIWELEKREKYFFGKLKSRGIDTEYPLTSIGCGLCDKPIPDYDNSYEMEKEFKERIEILKTYELEIDFDDKYDRKIEHWCLSEKKIFCN